MTGRERLLVPYFTHSKTCILTCLQSNASYNRLRVIILLTVFLSLHGNFFNGASYNEKSLIFDEMWHWLM